MADTDSHVYVFHFTEKGDMISDKQDSKSVHDLKLNMEAA